MKRATINIVVTIMLLCATFAPMGVTWRQGTVTSASGQNVASDLVQYPSAEVAFIIGPQLRVGSRLNPFVWYDQTALQTGLELGARFPVATPAQSDDAAWSAIHTNLYYDFVYFQYVNYYRTGDERFRTLARRVADLWWESPFIQRGTNRGGPTTPNPRTSQRAGMILRALDGRPEMWDWITERVTSEHQNWVKNRVNDATLYYDIREDGFAQLHAVMLARVLPDTFPNAAQIRATLQSNAETAAINFFGRLQKPDGSWRWDAYTGEKSEDQFINVEQPFMVGLYLDSAIMLHGLTTRADVKASIQAQVTRWCRHFYNDTFQNTPVLDLPGVRWRATDYFWGGGHMADRTIYEESRQSPWGATGHADDTSRRNAVRSARHLNSTAPAAFGFAYVLTGDDWYRRAGDDVADACYGEVGDGIHNLMNDLWHSKQYTMNRSSSMYFAYRMMGAAQDPAIVLPGMVVTPTPTPSPRPQPTPIGPPQAEPPPASSYEYEVVPLPATRVARRAGLNSLEGGLELFAISGNRAYLRRQTNSARRVYEYDIQILPNSDASRRTFLNTLTGDWEAFLVSGNEVYLRRLKGNE